MGTFLDDLDDHEGYADRRLPDGQLAGGVWTYATREFTAYVAACGCGWQARPPAAAANWPGCWSGSAARPAGWRTPPPWSASAAPWAGPAPWSMPCSAILSGRRPSGRTAVNADRPDPRRNGANGVRTDGHDPAAAPADPERRLAGPVSRLDRVTVQLGVAVAVVIALCS